MRNTKYIFTLFALHLCFGVYSQQYKSLMNSEKPNFFEIQKSAKAYFDSIGTQTSEYKHYKRWEYFAMRKMDSKGNIYTEKDFYKYTLQNKTSKKPDFSVTWKEEGPKAIQTNYNKSASANLGRITSIAVDPNNYNHILVGSPTGGIWETKDKGTSWNPIADDMAWMRIYSLTISPHNSNVIFAGVNRLGILKSEDGGLTWKAPTTNVNSLGYYSKILIHPNTPDTIFAAGNTVGLYRSTDGGDNWYQVNLGHKYGYDVYFNPNDPNIVYHAGYSVFKSNNGGDNWTEITGISSKTTEKMLGVSQADPNTIYILSAKSDGGFEALYKSSDGLTSASLVYPNGSENKNLLGRNIYGTGTGGQAPRDMAIAVSPTDINEIHVGGIINFASFDGGKTFGVMTSTQRQHWLQYMHADVDFIQYLGNTIYYCTDGGLFTSTNKGVSFNDLSKGLGIHQFYKIGVSQSKANFITAGAQDNGTSIFDNGKWEAFSGGDGMETFVDWNDANIIYSTSQNGHLYKSTNGGQSFSSISQPPSAGAWVTPFAQHPTNSQTLFTARDEVYKSLDGGASWIAISNLAAGVSSEMEVCKANGNIIYNHTMGKVWKTEDGGTTWKNILPATYSSPPRPINAIVSHPTDEKRVVLIISGAIIESKDGGTTWTDIRKGLTALGFYDGVFNDDAKNSLYINTIGKVFYINDDLSDWVEFGTGLPNVEASELEIQYNENKLYLATYGRGVWSADISEVPSLNKDVSLTLATSKGHYCGDSIGGVQVTLRNDGLNTISDPIDIKLYINGVLSSTKTFSSGLTKNEQVKVKLNTPKGISTNSHQLKAELSLAGDQDANNNSYELSVSVQNGSEHILSVLTDDKPSEIKWNLKNSGANVVQAGGEYPDIWFQNTTMTHDFCLLNDCFDFEITDAGKDGLSGSLIGDYFLTRISDNTKVFSMKDRSFTKEDHNYCVNTSATSKNKIESPQKTQVYPNPTKNQLNILLYHSAQITIRNINGQVLFLKPKGQNFINVDVQTYPAGTYFIEVISEAGNENLKFVKL